MLANCVTVFVGNNVVTRACQYGKYLQMQENRGDAKHTLIFACSICKQIPTHTTYNHTHTHTHTHAKLNL